MRWVQLAGYAIICVGNTGMSMVELLGWEVTFEF